MKNTDLVTAPAIAALDIAIRFWGQCDSETPLSTFRVWSWEIDNGDTIKSIKY